MSSKSIDFRNQELTVATDLIEGPIVLVESYLFKRWNQTFSRTAGNFLNSQSESIRKFYKKNKAESMSFCGLVLKIEFLEVIEKYYHLLWTDNWSNLENRVYIAKDDESALLIEIDRHPDRTGLEISIYFHKSPLPDLSDKNPLIKEAKKYIVLEEEESRIFLIKRTAHGYETEPFTFDKFKVDLNLNYGTGFEESVHNNIVKFAKYKGRPENGGLVLLHGLHSTGKTHYIRHLVNEIADVTKTIYIPAYLVESLADPSLIDFLREEQGSLLLVEDAEPVLCNTDPVHRSAATSNLLQMTEGMLSDCLKMKVIATFNADLKDVDSALYREGRLHLIHEFKKLSLDDAKRKAKDLNIDPDLITEAMSLGKLYNFKHDNGVREKKEGKVGFGA